MLVQALRQGGQPENSDEEVKAGKMVVSLLQRYYDSIGKSPFVLCTKISDFDVLVTAKYQ
jgi:hypothetical protein